MNSMMNIARLMSISCMMNIITAQAPHYACMHACGFHACGFLSCTHRPLAGDVIMTLMTFLALIHIRQGPSLIDLVQASHWPRNILNIIVPHGRAWSLSPSLSPSLTD